MIAVTIALALLTSAEPKAQLSLSVDNPTLKVGEVLQCHLKVKNTGVAPILVVQPNDGSDWHMRTPYTGFTFKPFSSREPWPTAPPRSSEPRCGNMNGLTNEELIDLSPGKSMELRTEWLLIKPKFDTPGKYRFRYYFTHTNRNPVQGLEIPANQKDVPERIMASKPYQLQSNEIVVTVKPA